jgi:TatD DNase family protein
MIRILREEKMTDGVIHCFTGSLSDAEAYMEMGFFLSIAGPVTYPSARDLRETVRKIPLERLLVETDCPLLAPQAYRGKRNEPAYVRYMAAEIAKVQERSLEEVAKHTSDNARRLFRL